MSSPVNVVLCLDKNYAYYAAVATYSIFVNSKADLRIFWIVPSEDESHIRPVVMLLDEKFGLKINLVSASVGDLAGWEASGYLSIGTYLRLLIPTLIHEPRAIYLDADTLVLSDLSALYSVDLGDNVIAGVLDVPGGTPSRVPRRDGDPYINAGVLVMDLAALRDDQLLTKAKDIYLKYGSEIVWHDQCIINKYAEGRKRLLPSGWNCQIPPAIVSEARFKHALSEENASILHFIGPNKPWQTWSKPYVSGLWWRYANQLGIAELKPEQPKTLYQADLLVQMLEEDQRFMEASQQKDKIIAELIDIIVAGKYIGDVGKHILRNPAWS